MENSKTGAMSDCTPNLAITTEEIYLKVMNKLQYDSYDMIVDNEGCTFKVPYLFEKVVNNDNHYDRRRIRRIAEETKMLWNGLPLSFGSTIFVRCDTSKVTAMKALIIGPPDTPYEDGCFIFDIYFPPNYPKIPMYILLETTGRNTVRFNPNLYENGFVCLSILNTWSGHDDEMWNPETSNLLQVLLGIQSQVFTKDPYFNEPGFENERGSYFGDAKSRKWNIYIQHANMIWAMIQQIKNPSPCFKEIILDHFWMKRDIIINRIKKWIDDVEKLNYPAEKPFLFSFKHKFKDLCKELSQLKCPKNVEPYKEHFKNECDIPKFTPLDNLIKFIDTQLEEKLSLPQLIPPVVNPDVIPMMQLNAMMESMMLESINY